MSDIQLRTSSSEVTPRHPAINNIRNRLSSLIIGATFGAAVLATTPACGVVEGIIPGVTSSQGASEDDGGGNDNGGADGADGTDGQPPVEPEEPEEIVNMNQICQNINFVGCHLNPFVSSAEQGRTHSTLHGLPDFNVITNIPDLTFEDGSWYAEEGDQKWHEMPKVIHVVDHGNSQRDPEHTHGAVATFAKGPGCNKNSFKVITSWDDSSNDTESTDQEKFIFRYNNINVIGTTFPLPEEPGDIDFEVRFESTVPLDENPSCAKLMYLDEHAFVGEDIAPLAYFSNEDEVDPEIINESVQMSFDGAPYTGSLGGGFITGVMTTRKHAEEDPSDQDFTTSNDLEATWGTTFDETSWSTTGEETWTTTGSEE